MQEKLKGVLEKIKGFFSKMSKKTRVILGVALGVVAVGAVVIALFLNTRTYPVLFTGLSAEDMTAVVTYLTDNGVTNYQVEGTDTIRVPPSQAEQLRADLLMQGYPNTGFAYDTYYKGVNGMSTQSDREIALKQDLQDRMAGTIRCMDGVKDAVVTITPAEDQRYVLDSGLTTEATAAVLVTPSGGTLSDEVATAIRLLVSHAVKGLNIENVAITDSHGNSYTAGGANTALDASALKLQLEEQTNNRVRTQIMLALIPFYGEGNLTVAVSSTVDLDHKVMDSTAYSLPDWAADGSTNGEGIIGSKIYDQQFVRNADGTIGGLVGNDTNADINTYIEGNARVNGDEDYIGNSGQIDYNTDTSKTQTERVAGYVTDLMVAVSINSSVSSSLTPAELENQIARAAGISPTVQADKINVITAPFHTDDDGIVPPIAPLIPTWAIYAAAGGAALLLFLLILLAILRKKRKKKKLAALEGMMAAAAAIPVEAGDFPPEGGADIMNIKTEKSIQLRQEIRKFAEESPEMAAQMLKSWLRGGEEDA